MFGQPEGQANPSFGSQFLLASRELSELGHPLVWITELNCELLRLHAPDLDRAPFRTRIRLCRAVVESLQGFPQAVLFTATGTV